MATARSTNASYDVDSNSGNDMRENPRRSERSRTLTEKGQEYQVKMLLERCKSKFELFSKIRMKLLKSIDDGVSLRTIKDDLKTFELCFHGYRTAHKEYVALLVDANAINEENDIFINAQHLFEEFRAKAIEEIRSIETDKDVSSVHTSLSRYSHRSYSSSSSSSVAFRLAEIAAKKASLQAEASFAETEVKIAQEEAKLKSELAQADAKLKSELAQTEAKLKAEAVRLQANVQQAEIQLQADKRRMNLQKEIAKAEAEENIFAQIDCENDSFSRRDVTHFAPNEPFVVSPHQFHTAEQTALTNENLVPAPENTAVPFVTNHMNANPAYSNTAENEVSYPLNLSTAPQNPSADGASSSEIKRLVETVVDIQQRASLPNEEPEVFDGDLLKFPIWLGDFEDLIERNVRNPNRRLRYLLKYTTGDARKAIEGFMGIDDENAYNEAKATLMEWYGDSATISRAYKQRLKQWPIIPMNDGGKGMREFCHFLTSCKLLVKNSTLLKKLDDEDLIQVLVLKLPKSARDRWSSNACEYHRKHGSFPPFSEFCDHVKKISKVTTLPLYGTGVLDELVANNKKAANVPVRRRTYNRGSHSYSIDASEEVHSSRQTAKSKTTHFSDSCVCCKGSHDLNDCTAFLKKSYNDRIEFIKSNGICFACLRKGHRSKGCTKRKTCKTCGKGHPTAIHSEEFVRKVKTKIDSNEENSLTNADCKKSIICHASEAREVIRTTRIVPIQILCADRPSKKLKVYAILDEQSDTTFISDDVRRSLESNGFKVRLNLSTMTSSTVVDSYKIMGLQILGCNGHKLNLPPCYTRDSIPVNRNQIIDKRVLNKYTKFQDILDEIPDCDPNIDIGILIGTDCMQALRPLQIISDADTESYAIKTALGWGVVGMIDAVCVGGYATKTCNKVISHDLYPPDIISPQFVPINQVKEVINPCMILRSFEQDFIECMHKNNIKKQEIDGTSNKPISIEDRRFLQKCQSSIHRTQDGHYEMSLPFRNKEVKLSNNKQLALRCLQGIKKRFEKDERFKELYCAFMKDAIEKGYAERLSDGDNGNHGYVWYIPHHGVFHPCKPNKIRVVFNCSSEFEGQSLNGHLLQGPDLTNSLISVLARFREKEIAFMADIESMFYQVRINEEDRDFVRFLWWDYGDCTKKPSCYRMRVMVFGSTSSPSCCNFVLKKTADDYEKEFGEEAAQFLRKNFYVDDGLKSVDSVEEATSLIKASKKMCAKGGFNLTKFVSNNNKVLQAVDENDRSTKFKNLDLGSNPIPVERALGVQWCIVDDSFTFRITLKDRPFTRRGILSTVCSIYDPFGFIAPVILEGKRTLQELCRDKCKWDEPVPYNLKPRWERWRNDLHHLAELKIRRCFKPSNFGEIKETELHHFSDASTRGYGQCTYLRLTNQKNQIHCSFVMGKSRVAPLKPITIPRLELTAALVSVRVGVMLRQELNFVNIKETYWTDSKVVLGYVSNDSRRFHIYVANRVQEIRDHSEPNQWFYVDTKNNPADDASRGLCPKDLLTKHDRYLKGPDFLWKPLTVEKEFSHEFEELDASDPEIRNSVTFLTEVKEQSFPSLLERLSMFSSLYKAQRFVVILCRWLKILQNRRNKNLTSSFDSITVQEMEDAKKIILKLMQCQVYPDEIEILNKPKKFDTLDPCIRSDGLLRIGGRLKDSSLPEELKHPVILPKSHHITTLIIKRYHEVVKHQGRGITLNEIRSAGFWIVPGIAAVSSFIHHCTKCRRLRGTFQEQKMADLPKDRMDDSPCFSFCATDLFGPFIIKERRKELKRYGVLFTCMASRAVRVEIAPSLETDSFINALRRFICRNGPIRQLRCDRGTNMVGASRELKEGLQAMNHSKIQEVSLRENCDYFPFKFNVSAASYQGGVWERQIRSVRAVLSSILEKNGRQLDEDSLRTLMAEAEAVVNGRPLVVDNLSCPDSPLPLTPNHLLTAKTRLVLPPPGVFGREDLYSRKRWRRVQHLANEFWIRFRKEYLQSLQVRQKWNKVQRDLKIGDIVIVVDENTPRNQWKMARIVDVYPDADGHVRRVRVHIGDSTLDERGKRIKDVLFLDRPIQKLILFLESGDTGEDSRRGSQK
uniref:uncharacterized protein LOC120334671 n=1 Tax=Styela clava TaxID=7725 RepID=UPI00193A33E1|nr:uncharacterized protein LOC120334671 [Styela clava]